MLDQKQPIYTLTVEQFRDLMTEVLKEAMSSAQDAPVKKTDEIDDVLTVQELAGFLHCSEATIFNHRKKGWLPSPYQVGRKVIWKKSEVMEFMKTPINKRKKAA